jgi:predicted Zn-dependent protease with MMP-like domain
MDKEKFEEIILDTLENIPRRFKEKIKNLAIVIEDEDINFTLKNIKKNPGKYTLGLYQGLPATKRTGKIFIFPDKITIYKKNLEKVSKNDKELEKNTRRVVLHELGHYFGLDEKQLKKLGY